MVAIVEEISIEASPKRVWEAITQQEEIVRWWAYEARVEPEVGSVGEFSFRRGAFAIQFEVAELDRDRKIHWIAKAPPQWEGTSITWQLTPVHNGTRVVFTHDGFVQIDERTRASWIYFLASLKSYLETGKGTPGNPPGVR